ncbi:hypothetical protein OG592_06530 [Streptomyces avidinii]|nr:hypothetical protein OG592_06530 [Streptomyces avidinii]
MGVHSRFREAATAGKLRTYGLHTIGGLAGTWRRPDHPRRCGVDTF